MMFKRVFVLFWLLVSPAPLLAAELVMLEQAGCSYCQTWDEQIGGFYHKTSEGKRAPLRRVNIHKPWPQDLAKLQKGRYTPTFILVENGTEIGRIRGYPGEDFFWALLAQLIEKLPPQSAPKS